MLSIIRLQVYTDGGPVFPRSFIVLGHIPSCINTIRIREFCLAAAMINNLTIFIKHLEAEVRFFIVRVTIRILQNHSVPHNKQALVRGINQNIVSNRFRLRMYIPVTQAY